jgi:replicative DNA helicase
MDGLVNGPVLKQIDLITLQDSLKQAGKLDQVGGIAYLMSLSDAVPSASNLPYYTAIVKREWRRRQMLRALAEGQSAVWGMDESSDIEAVMDRVEQSIFALNDRHAAKDHTLKLKEVLRDVMDRLEQFSYHPFLKNFGKISEVKKSIMLDRCERSIDRIGGGFAIPCLTQASD